MSIKCTFIKKTSSSGGRSFVKLLLKIRLPLLSFTLSSFLASFLLVFGERNLGAGVQIGTLSCLTFLTLLAYTRRITVGRGMLSTISVASLDAVPSFNNTRNTKKKAGINCVTPPAHKFSGGGASSFGQTGGGTFFEVFVAVASCETSARNQLKELACTPPRFFGDCVGTFKNEHYKFIILQFGKLSNIQSSGNTLFKIAGDKAPRRDKGRSVVRTVS